MPLSVHDQQRSYYSAEPYRISYEAVADFSRALGYRVAESEAELTVPFTFPIVIVMKAWEPIFNDPDLDISLDGAIHADQRFDMSRSLAVGDEIMTRSIIEKVRCRAQRTMVSIRVEFSTVAGEKVGSALSQLILPSPLDSQGK